MQLDWLEFLCSWQWHDDQTIDFAQFSLKILRLLQKLRRLQKIIRGRGVSERIMKNCCKSYFKFKKIGHFGSDLVILGTIWSHEIKFRQFWVKFNHLGTFSVTLNRIWSSQIKFCQFWVKLGHLGSNLDQLINTYQNRFKHDSWYIH